MLCLYLSTFSCLTLRVFPPLPSPRLSQAAADYVKAHLPDSLKQQLQAFEREKRESALSYSSILEQRILTVDREMLDKLSANHDEAGQKGGRRVVGSVNIYVQYMCACWGQFMSQQREDRKENKTLNIRGKAG